MKNYKTILYALAGSLLMQQAGAQQTEPICINYRQYISQAYDAGLRKDKEEGKQNSHFYTEQVNATEYGGNSYRKDYNFNHSKLDSAQIRKLTDTFLKYVKQKGEVTNYDHHLSLNLSNAKEEIVEQCIRKISSGEIERLGEYYVYGKELGSKLTAKDNVVLRNGEEWIYDDLIFLGIDTVYSEDPETSELALERVKNYRDLYEDIVGLSFIELWTFDHNGVTFNKDIRYLGLDIARHGEMDEYRGMARFLHFETGKAAGAPQEGHLIKKDVINDVLFDNLTGEEGRSYLLENADGWNYIESSKRMNLVVALLNAVATGKAEAYEMPLDPAELPVKRIKKKDFFKLYIEIDTVYIEEPETMEMVPEIIVKYTRVEDILGLRFVEDWYLDPETFVFFKKVKYIGLMKPVSDGPGAIWFETEAYIKLN